MCEFKDIKNTLPHELQEIIKGGIWEENKVGHSNSRLFKITLNNRNTYLKISNLSMKEVESEAIKYEWLKGRISVPEVLYFNKSDNYYLLMSEIEGSDASQEENLKKPTKTIKLLANGLRMIHKIDIKNCNFIEPVDFIDEIKQKNQLDKDTLIKLENKPNTLDLVFTHGDYCLPNVVIKDDKISGFIDMGRASVADRYLDLADVVRSIRYNFNREDLVNMFLDTYGLDKVDRSKLDYYIMLCDLL